MEWNCDSLTFTNSKLDNITLTMLMSSSINPINFTISDCTDENWNTNVKSLKISEITTFELTKERSIVRHSIKQKRRAGSIHKYKFKIGLKELKQKTHGVFSPDCGSLPYIVFG